MGDGEAGCSKRHRLSLSPSSKSKAEEACLIHMKNCPKEAKLRGFSTQRSIDAVNNASVLRQDTAVHGILQTGLFCNERFHQYCYDQYTHSGTLRIIKKRKKQNEAPAESPTNTDNTLDQTDTRRSSARKRDRGGKIVADSECCICFKKKPKKGGGYESLTKCVTQTAAETLQRCATDKNDNSCLMAYVSGVDWDTTSLEIWYHRTCYQQYTRHRPSTQTLPSEDESVVAVHSYVENHVIKDFEVLPTNKLADIYRMNCPQSAGHETPDKRTLSRSVCQKFEERIVLWKPKYGESFIFNFIVDKGRIIEVLCKKIDELNDKLKPIAIEEQVINVGEAIRNEVNSIPPTYEEWPPNKDSLYSKKTETPPLLNLLSVHMLTSENRVGTQKKSRLDSICQDIIYTATNGKHRCSKQVTLALCTKRKTGSKDMVTWMNRHGNGISYDEVNFVETFLAEKMTKDADVKSFVQDFARFGRLSNHFRFIWEFLRVRRKLVRKHRIVCLRNAWR